MIRDGGTRRAAGGAPERRGRHDPQAPPVPDPLAAVGPAAAPGSRTAARAPAPGIGRAAPRRDRRGGAAGRPRLPAAGAPPHAGGRRAGGPGGGRWPPCSGQATMPRVVALPAGPAGAVAVLRGPWPGRCGAGATVAGRCGPGLPRLPHREPPRRPGARPLPVGGACPGGRAAGGGAGWRDPRDRAPAVPVVASRPRRDRDVVSAPQCLREVARGAGRALPPRSGPKHSPRRARVTLALRTRKAGVHRSIREGGDGVIGTGRARPVREER
jgi:hypothetical protein